MLSTTFVGQVQQGQLQINQPLVEFEGRQVLVTLIAPDMPLQSTTPGSEGRGQMPVASPEPELLEDTGRIRVTPRATQTVTARIIAVGRRSIGPSVGEE